MANIYEENFMEAKEYPGDFGREFEGILCQAFKEKLGSFVDEVELATPEEDQFEKVDLWIKFKGLPDPIGVDVTFTDSRERLQEKLENLKRKPLAKKQERPNALIKAPGNSYRVITNLDKIKIAAATEKAKKKCEEMEKQDHTSVEMADFLDESVVAEALRQIISGLPPHKRAILLDNINKNIKIKKSGKESSRLK